MSDRKKSPYLETDGRLGDVIAAIQAMGIYKFYLGTFEKWAKRISGDTSLAEHWGRVFAEHPEFFRLDSEKKEAGLVLRRQRPKRYDTDNEVLLSKLEFQALDGKAKKKISREPLTPDQISALIDVAIKLRARAAEQHVIGDGGSQRPSRLPEWWLELF